MLQTVGDFSQFKIPYTIDPSSPEFRNMASSDFFNFKAYLDWQKERSEANRDNNIDFVRHLIMTQGFCTFIERVCTRQDQSYLETTPEQFFELNLEIMLETSLKKLKQTQQDYLDRAKQNLA